MIAREELVATTETAGRALAIRAELGRRLEAARQARAQARQAASKPTLDKEVCQV